MLALSQRDRPDLVLLDMGLPGMDGLDALRLFKQQADTPVIFVTARRRELDTILGLELVSTTTSPSPSTRTCCWRASRPCYGAARSSRVGKQSQGV